MVRYGGSRRSLVLRARSPERAAQLLEKCDQLGRKAVVGIEPDKPEDITDLERVLNRSSVTRVPSSFVQRNGPCPCGSGSKYKNCCAR
jgi:SWIM/SEC-C metal-binding protein